MRAVPRTALNDNCTPVVEQGPDHLGKSGVRVEECPNRRRSWGGCRGPHKSDAWPGPAAVTSIWTGSDRSGPSETDRDEVEQDFRAIPQATAPREPAHSCVPRRGPVPMGLIPPSPTTTQASPCGTDAVGLAQKTPSRARSRVTPHAATCSLRPRSARPGSNELPSTMPRLERRSLCCTTRDDNLSRGLRQC